MPLLLKRELPCNSVIGVWKIDESLEELLAYSETKGISSTLIDFYKSERRKKELLAVRILLDRLSPNGDVKIEYTDSGKPILRGSDLSISISHTDGLAAILLSSSSYIGLDIELFSDRVCRIADRFLRDDEKFAYKTRKLETKLAIWCAKEVLFKYINKEGVDFKRHLHVLPFRYEKRGGLFYTCQYRVKKGFKKFIPMYYESYANFILVYTLH